MNSARLLTPIVFILSAVLAVARAEELSGHDIAVKVDGENRSDSEVATFEMTIDDGKGKQRVRKLRSFALTPKGQDDKTVLRFLDPPDVAGTAVLTLEHGGAEDEQWIYLPAQKRTRRIGAGQRRESFMGSDLSYDDLRPRDVEAYSYKVLRSEKVAESDCYVLESTPVAGRKAADSEYSRSVSWIRRQGFVPLRTELYDKEGTLYKTIAYSGYESVSGLERPEGVLVENRKKGSRTTVRYLERTLNQKLDDTLFTTRSLEMQP